jgi:hypothetical protein
MDSRPDQGVVRRMMWALAYTAAEDREKSREKNREKKSPSIAPRPQPDTEPAKGPPAAERVGPGSQIRRYSPQPGRKGVRKPPAPPAPDPIKPPD